MNLSKKSLLFALLISLLLFLTTPVIWPQMRLFYWVPFLIILYYQKPFLTCLWGSLLCGIFVDLVSSNTRFGVYALNYTFTTALLYEQRRHFFGDSLSTLPIMVFLFSGISTLLQVPLVYIFEQEILISWRWLLSDVFLLPFCDALYAFTLFIVPFFLMGKSPRQGREYFAN